MKNRIKTLLPAALFGTALFAVSTLAAPSAWNALGTREQTLATFESEMFGRRPVERPERLSFAQEEPDREVLGGKAVLRRVRIAYGGKWGDGSFVVTAVLPKPLKRRAAFLLINRAKPMSYLEGGDDRRRGYWPIEEIVGRGYAALSFWYGDVAPDRSYGNSKGVFECFEDLSVQYRPKDSWGTLSAWAWGASRVMDWIETEPLVDKGRVAVVGHSRGGKAALWTGVTDTRFAMACVSGSGCCGAKLNAAELPRSEHFADIAVTFSFWFTPQFIRNVNRDKEVRFDQHHLLALMAPRILCVASGSEDAWAGPEGEYEACRLASPAWDAAGAKGLVSDGFPQPGEVRSDGRLVYSLHDGGHRLGPFEWKVFMDAADKNGWRDDR